MIAGGSATAWLGDPRPMRVADDHQADIVSSLPELLHQALRQGGAPCPPDDLGQRCEDAEVLGERKLRHHLDGAAAVRTRVGASFDHLPNAADDVVQRFPCPLRRDGSRSSPASVPRHSAGIEGAAVSLTDLRWSLTHASFYLFLSTMSSRANCPVSPS